MEYDFHLLPSGIINPKVTAFIGVCNADRNTLIHVFALAEAHARCARTRSPAHTSKATFPRCCVDEGIESPYSLLLVISITASILMPATACGFGLTQSQTAVCITLTPSAVTSLADGFLSIVFVQHGSIHTFACHRGQGCDLLTILLQRFPL